MAWKIRPMNPDGYYKFWCPGCEDVHVVNATWSVNVEVDTITPSVLVRGGSRDITCHSFVTNGRIQFLTDSTHALAGQTVDLPDWDAEVGHVDSAVSTDG